LDFRTITIIKKKQFQKDGMFFVESGMFFVESGMFFVESDPNETRLQLNSQNAINKLLNLLIKERTFFIKVLSL
jgi:hypothetical protein